MKTIKMSVKLVVILSMAYTLSSCAGKRVLIQPAAAKVKKIALVNVTAKRGNRNLDGGGGITKGLSMITSMVGAKSGSKVAKMFGGNDLTDYTVEAFNAEFSKLKGWQTVPTDQVLSSEAYKKFQADLSKWINSELGLSTVSSIGLISPDKMPVLPYQGRHSEEKKLLSELAKAIDVDAVAVVSLDMAYSPHTAFAGMGSAKARAGLALVMVNQSGAFIAKTDDVIGRKKKGYRESSEETAGLVAGELIYNSKARSMYEDSIKKGLIVLRNAIQSDLDE